MAALAGTKYGTEFAGSNRVVTVLVTGGTQTGTVQFTNLTTIRGLAITPATAPAAPASLVMATATTNIVTVRQYTAQGTLNTQTAMDFYLTVIGEY